MFQLNPMNKRNQDKEERNIGHTRKSAATVKPKTKAAASVTIKKAGKTVQDRKAAEKQAKEAEKAERRRIERTYYKPDTQRYKSLRRIWWACLIIAFIFAAVSWITSDVHSTVSTGFMIAAYALLLCALLLDFTKISQERTAYQERMAALEKKQKKEEKAEARAASAGAKKNKGSGRNTTQNPKTQAKMESEKATVAEVVGDEQ